MLCCGGSFPIGLFELRGQLLLENETDWVKLPSPYVEGSASMGSQGDGQETCREGPPEAVRMMGALGTCDGLRPLQDSYVQALTLST